jgi:MtaA/CmuA family methyltransferase
MNGRERTLAHFDNQPVDRLPLMPITMMFATDRIGKKYGEYAQDYRVLVEGQLRTAEEFDFDYVSCISDPTREATDCGAHIEFFEDQPPAIVESDALLADKNTLRTLNLPDPLGGGRMHDRVRAAEEFKRRVGNDLLIEGWIEGPCAQAADLRGINTLMIDFLDDELFVRDLFDFVLEMELAFAKAQIEAGVDLIGIGDAAASLISKQTYEEVVLPYEARLIDGVRDMGAHVRLHICGNTRHLLKGMSRLNWDFTDVDYPVPLADARADLGPDRLVAANLDPVRDVRDGTPASIQAALAECHRIAGRRFIVAAGCEIPRDTPAENVLAMTDFARATKPEDVVGE